MSRAQKRVHSLGTGSVTGRMSLKDTGRALGLVVIEIRRAPIVIREDKGVVKQ
jgi:hypothetical protein